jgi:hypothetical protein
LKEKAAATLAASSSAYSPAALPDDGEVVDLI